MHTPHPSSGYCPNSIYTMGPSRLHGSVSISGAKNAALPILAATLLCTKGTSTLHNLPRLSDIEYMIQAMMMLGTQMCLDDAGAIHLNNTTCTNAQLSLEICKKTRASILLLGPLLARFGKVTIPHPGGCEIGKRPIDQHLHGLVAMGATVSNTQTHCTVEAPQGLTGVPITLKHPASVTGTENLILAASLAKGTTRIYNAAREPEVDDLICFLNTAGAKIKRHSDHSVEIAGVQSLTGCAHQIIGDRLEAGTFLIAAAATHGEIIVKHINPKHLEIVLEKLRQAGCHITTASDQIHLKAPEEISPVSIETMPYPGFPTDLQPQWMSLMVTALGKSTISETIFENRFQHVPSLRALGANIQIASPCTAHITGTTNLQANTMQASDIRAAAALLIAGLCAQGCSLIQTAHYIDRGHEDLSEKLRRLNITIFRTKKILSLDLTNV